MSNDQQVHTAENRDVEQPVERTAIPKSRRVQATTSDRGWAERPRTLPPLRPAAAAAAAERRAALSTLHTGQRARDRRGRAEGPLERHRLPVPGRTPRSPGSPAGATDTVAGSVLVFEPTDDGHDVTLYFQPAAGRDTDEFYANAAIGEFWVGARPTVDEVGADLGLATRRPRGLRPRARPT